MFQEKNLMLLYTISPVHMGAGTALGAIDNPIQRERHTGHPMLQGSGLKGAFRHHAETREDWRKNGLVDAIFGPESNASDHAGALAFGDGQVLLFPVRSLKHSFYYATCPTALQRFCRAYQLATGRPLDTEAGKLWEIQPQGVACALATQEEKLILEAFQFEPLPSWQPGVEKLAKFLAEQCLPEKASHFREKMKKHLVVLSDEAFNFFVHHSTVVEPHVAIEDASGTAAEGRLFYTENVPPESVFFSLVMASQERKKKGESGGMAAKEVLEKVEKAFNDQLVQVGGDATTGRGLMVVRFLEVNHGGQNQ